MSNNSLSKVTGAAGGDDKQTEYLRSLLSGLQSVKSPAVAAAESTSAAVADQSDFTFSRDLSAAAQQLALDASFKDSTHSGSPLETSAVNTVNSSGLFGPAGGDLSKVLAAWMDEASVSAPPPMQQQGGGFTVSSPAAAGGSHHNSSGLRSNNGSGLHHGHHHNMRPAALETLLVDPSPVQVQHQQQWNLGSNGRGGAASANGRFEQQDSPSSVGSWSRRSGAAATVAAPAISRDPMLAPSTPSASQPFVPPATSSILRTSNCNGLVALPPMMPPVSMFAPFQASHHIVAVLNLEAKTSQRQLFQVFFPLGATDAMVFAPGAAGLRKSGVVLFNSADAASMAAEKIDNFVPHGQSQPLTCVFLPKGEQARAQQIQDQQNSALYGFGTSAAASGGTSAGSGSSNSGRSTPSGSAGDTDAHGAANQPPSQQAAGLGSFQVTSSTACTPHETHLLRTTYTTTPPPGRASTANSTNTSTAAASNASQIGVAQRGGAFATPPPTPAKPSSSANVSAASSRHDGVVPSARPSTRPQVIASLLQNRASISEVYPVLTAAVIGQPAQAVTAVVDATVAAIHGLLTSAEQQRSCLKAVASLIRHLAEDQDPTMKVTFQEPISRCVMRILLDADEEPASRSACGVACGYLFDYTFIGGNPFAMSRKLMGRAPTDPNIVDALVSLTSSWSSRHADRVLTADDVEAEADFRRLVKQFYEAQGRSRGPEPLALDVSSLNSTGSEPPQNTSAADASTSWNAADRAAGPAAVTAAAATSGAAAGAGANTSANYSKHSVTSSSGHSSSLLSNADPLPSAKPMPHGGITTTTFTAGGTITASTSGAVAAAAAAAAATAAAAAAMAAGVTINPPSHVRETTLQKDLLQSTVYITRIPAGAREDRLRQLFLEYGGEFNKVRLYDDGNSRGRGAFCFVEFVHAQSARALIRHLNNYPVGDSTLLVSYARSAIHDQDPRDAVFTPELGKIRDCLFGVVPGPAHTSPPPSMRAAIAAEERPPAGFSLGASAAFSAQKLNAGASAFTPGVGWGGGARTASGVQSSNHRDPLWAQ